MSKYYLVRFSRLWICWNCRHLALRWLVGSLDITCGGRRKWYYYLYMIILHNPSGFGKCSHHAFEGNVPHKSGEACPISCVYGLRLPTKRANMRKVLGGPCLLPCACKFSCPERPKNSFHEWTSLSHTYTPQNTHLIPINCTATFCHLCRPILVSVTHGPPFDRR